MEQGATLFMSRRCSTDCHKAGTAGRSFLGKYQTLAWHNCRVLIRLRLPPGDRAIQQPADMSILLHTPSGAMQRAPGKKESVPVTGGLGDLMADIFGTRASVRMERPADFARRTPWCRTMPCAPRWIGNCKAV
jgi:hypothetical protein